MYFLQIGGVQLPAPSYYAVDAEDINSTDSRRSDETGLMHRRRLRAGVRTVKAKWILPGAQAHELVKKLSAPVLEVSMLDTAAEGYYSCNMFASSLESVFYQKYGETRDSCYWEVSCRLTEY